MPRHDGYVLILRHSMGYDRFPELLALPAPKVLLYHNITPTALLARHPYLARYAELGRAQLAAVPAAVRAALADSDYNAVELRRLGLRAGADLPAAVRRGRAARPRRRGAAMAPTRDDRGVFTLLFVGRVNAAKGQRELVHAYAAFRAASSGRRAWCWSAGTTARTTRSCRRCAATSQPLGLDAHVHLTGGVDDVALDRRYAEADLYVSLSRHEGFGVPLVEAMAHGVPVLALAAGAVPYTLAGAGLLLDDAAPAVLAAALLELARDPAAREALRTPGAPHASPTSRWTGSAPCSARRCCEPAQPYPTSRRWPPASTPTCGSRSPATSTAATAWPPSTGDLAAALDAARPGRVRLLPVEGAATLDAVRRPRRPGAPPIEAWRAGRRTRPARSW